MSLDEMLAVLTAPIAPDKSSRRERRRCRALHKEQARAKNASWQRGADTFKKACRHKGAGRARKIKGQVMPTVISLNDTCSKGWASLCDYRESMKTLYLYSRT